MKKRINNVSYALGVAAIAYAMLTIPSIVEILRQPEVLSNTTSANNANYVQSFESRDILAAIRSGISGTGNLLGLAAIAEFLDRIRVQMREAGPPNL